MRFGSKVGAAAGPLVVLTLAGGACWAQPVAHRHEEARDALAAQIWGQGPGTTLDPPTAGGVRLIYQSPLGQAGLAYLPGERTVHAVALAPDDDRMSRKRAKLGYAITDEVELFVDLQKRKPSTAEEALAQDWLPPATRRPRTFSLGVAARW